MLQVCIRVTVINFTVTAEGLEEQLLGDCVRRERPDLEEQRDSLLQSISADKRQLQVLFGGKSPHRRLFCFNLLESE